MSEEGCSGRGADVVVVYIYPKLSKLRGAKQAACRSNCAALLHLHSRAGDSSAALEPSPAASAPIN